MKVYEVFRSIQGEGYHTGAPTTFVRFAGCNLQCSYCDTPYAREAEGVAKIPPAGVLDAILRVDRSPSHLCLTGGEPLLQPRDELASLLLALSAWTRSKGLRSIVVETNGATPVDWILGHPSRPVVTLCVDFKLPSSGMRERMIWGNFERLSTRDVVKFVCSDTEDFLTALGVVRTLEKFKDANPTILFHAKDGLPERWLAGLMLKEEWMEERFAVRFGVQLHKLIWGRDTRL